MAHARDSIDYPEVPAVIRQRIVPFHRGYDIPEHLRELELQHPGVLDAIVRTIGMLESYPGVESTSVDHDEDDVLYPVTIWVNTVYSGEERFRHILDLESRAEETLGRYPDLVLVAIL